MDFAKRLFSLSDLSREAFPWDAEVTGFSCKVTPKLGIETSEEVSKHEAFTIDGVPDSDRQLPFEHRS